MRSKGWLYYPDTCATTQCKLVVFLHGGGSFGVEMLESHGLGGVANANNMAILFPQGDVSG